MAKLSTILQTTNTAINGEPSGTFQAVASGTLANGDKVVVNSDGTVSVVAESIGTVPASIPAGSETQYSADSYGDHYIAFDPAQTGKFVLVYQDGAGSNYGKAVVGTMSGTTITFGTVYTFNASYTVVEDIAFDTLTPGLFAIVYKDVGASGVQKVVAGTISGSTLTFGTGTTVYTSSITATDQVKIAFDSATAGQFLVVLPTLTNYYLYAQAGTISGTVVTKSASYATLNSYGSSGIKMVAHPVDGKFIIVFNNAGNSDRPTVIVLTIPYTYSTAQIGVGYWTPNVTVSPTTNKLLFSLSSTGFSYLRQASLSGYTVSWESTNYGLTSDVIHDLKYDPNQSNKVIISEYRNGYNQIVATINSATDVTFSTTYTFTNATQPVGLAFDANTPYYYVSVYSTTASTPYPAVAVVCKNETVDIVTTLTANNFIGISDGTYADAETATIQLAGAVNNAQTGLTAGNKYYLQTNGNLSLTPDTPSVFAGTAISSTGIIVKG